MAQPALAVIWAFLLLGEELVWGQVVGIAIVTVGLLAFILLNERGEPGTADEQQDAEITLAGEGSGAVM